MSKLLGEKIKQLRKELKMTQSELADAEMTKSMLSHIENGTANPSIKTLQHIATKLNKPIAFFLEEDENLKIDINQNEKLPIDHIIQNLNEIDMLMENKAFKLCKEELTNLLASYSFNVKSKVYADILYRLGMCNIELKDFESGEKYIHSCSDIYILNTLYVDAARAQLSLLRKPLDSYSYSDCIEIFDKAYELYNKSSSKDIFLEIELLAKQTPIAIALGDFDKTIKVCEKAIKLSSENNIYYLTDSCYRNIAISHLLQGDLNKFVKNIEKSKKYVEFTGNRYLLARICQNYAMYANMINDPERALNYLKIYEENTEERAFYYYLEVARANYLLGNYGKALEILNKVDYDEKIHYLIDCIYVLNGKVLKGLILNKLKKYDEAILSIEEATKEIEPYTKVKYKGFVKYAYKELGTAFEALSESYSLKGDYEKAYRILKKSSNVKALINLY